MIRLPMEEANVFESKRDKFEVLESLMLLSMFKEIFSEGFEVNSLERSEKKTRF
jgi:hypothetical protein